MKMVTYTHMKQMNFLKFGFFFAFILSGFIVNAQCDLACNLGGVQISLDANCSGVITPDHILEGFTDDTDGDPNDGHNEDCPYKVVIYHSDNTIVDMSQYSNASTPDDYTDDVWMSHPMVSSDDVDSTYKVSVFLGTDPNANSCWGTLIIEDKIPPQIECLDTVSVDCNADTRIENIQASSSEADACAGTPVALADDDYEFTIAMGASFNGWELISSFDLDVTSAAACDFSDYTIDILTPGGGMFQVSYDAGDWDTSELLGMQTGDNVVGDWVFTVASPTQTCALTDLCVDIESVSFYSYGYEENCDDVTVEIIGDELAMLDCRDDDEEHTAARDITYVVKDASDNADTCVFTLLYIKKGLDDIMYPDDIVVNCSADDNMDGVFDNIFLIYDTNNNGELEPSETGVPTLDGNPIYPTPDPNYCMFNVAFDDFTYESCGGTFKLRRTWQVYDWCEAVIESHEQIIKSVDDQPPLYFCPPLEGVVLESNFDPFDCTGDLLLEPWVVGGQTGSQAIPYDCSDDGTGIFDIEIFYKEANEEGIPEPGEPFSSDGVINNGDGTYTLPSVAGPRVWIRYAIADACGNLATIIEDGIEYPYTCAFEIDIIDGNPPTAVCDEFIAVSLGENGWGRVYANSVDDGSHDCDSLTYQIRRVSGPVCNVDEFEAPGHNDLQFDDFTQFCCDDLGADPGIMVEMQVEDQGGNTASCMTFVVVQDKYDPTLISCPDDRDISCLDINNLTTALTGVPVVEDNCGFTGPFFDQVDDLDDCNIGTIELEWYVLDLSGTRFDFCTQELTVERDITVGGDIDFPGDIINPPLSSCDGDDVGPNAQTGEYPTYNGTKISDVGACADLTYTHNDQFFVGDDDACYKILRTWTVVDWCIYDPENPSAGGIYSHTQTIKINSQDDPEITSCTVSTTEACVDQSNNCRAEVTGSISATDACSGDAITDSDNYYWSITSDGELFDDGNGSSFNVDLPAGNYDILWEVTDRCGNTETCGESVSVTDCGTPTPYCIGSLTVTLMPGTGQVELWASDFVLKGPEYVYDDCDDDVTFSFSANPLDQAETFNCDNEGMNVINIFFTDDSGNQDFCTVELNIQDNEGDCDQGGGTKPAVAGTVRTEIQEEVSSVSVMLEAMSDHSQDYLMTENDGHFMFEELNGNEDYMLMPTKNDDHLNGVSTLDIVLIQQHILGISELDSPYKMIAADVTDNQKITAGDLVEIRQLILGVITEYNTNHSWRFVDAEEQFVDPSSPWPFTEQIMINDITLDEMYHDFVAVKIGDVNDTAIVDFGDDADTRNAQSVDFILEKEDNVIHIIPAEDMSLFGFQFTLDFGNAIELRSIDSDVVQWQSSNANVSSQDAGLVMLSWNDIELNQFQAGKPILSVTLASLTDEKVNINSQITKAEAYGENLEVYNINSTWMDSDSGFEVFQNRPNPFSQSTLVSFMLPEDDMVRLEIFDVNGKIIQSQENWYKNGLNEIEINLQNGGMEGVLYYEISTSNFSAVRKMISIK